MRSINKIFSLIKNKDVISYFLFTLLHPFTIFSGKTVNSSHSYISKDGLVNIDDIRSDYTIRKLRFPCRVVVKNDIGFFDNPTTRIHLAGVDDNVDNKSIDWLKLYSDPEDIAAFHRFIWLYRIIWENGICSCTAANNWVKSMVYSWISSVESKDKKTVHPEVWQTYSVVERIVNWTIILGLTEVEDDKDEEIVSSIIRQLDYIQRNLEYYGDEFTGNHFCNDGRGLYICGTVFGIKEFAELGKTIIKDMLPKIAPDSTFLREGSTHYQFLVTKWICDCFWIARECGDEVFANWLKPFLVGLAEGCRFFMIIGKDVTTIPLIGDISPDLDPKWIIGAPMVADFMLSGSVKNEFPDSKGFHSIIFRQKANSKCISERSLIDGNKEWKKLDLEGFEIFAHVNNLIYPNNLTGHFHHDSGSLVAYYNGLPLLIDSGRVNYIQTGAGMWMRSCFGHNLFIIDGYDPEPDMRSFFSKDFLDIYTPNAPEIKKSGSKITTIVYGGERIKGIYCHKRDIEVVDDSIVVQDSIEGHGVHKGCIVFHIDKMWDVKEENGIIQLSNGLCQFEIKSEGIAFRVGTNNIDEDSYFGYYSDKYGSICQCSSIIGSVCFDAPFMVKTQIKRIYGY